MMNGSAGASASFEQHPKRRPPPLGPSDHERQQQRKLLSLSMQQQDDDVAAGVVPPVTVVLDGRCICHRILLTRHTGYRSLAGALRRMFVDGDAGGAEGSRSVEADHGLDLSNAVPGHVVAYEDMEDDLLLAGDLNWKDFVRVAKRIRIIPAKSSNRRKQQCGGVGGARGREAGLLRAHGRAGGRVPRPVLPQRRAAVGGPALDGAAGRSGLRRARRQGGGTL